MEMNLYQLLSRVYIYVFTYLHNFYFTFIFNCNEMRRIV